MPTSLPVRNIAPDNLARTLNGRSVLLMFCAFFGVIFAMNALFMYFAFSTFGGIDAAGAYRKNFLLTSKIAAAERQNNLGWSVSGSISRSGTDTASISLNVVDKDAQPVDVKSVTAELRRPADKRLDAIVVIQRTGPNTFRGSASRISAGQWDFVVTLASSRGERFHSKNRIVLK